jgi:hypothetical protein
MTIRWSSTSTSTGYGDRSSGRAPVATGPARAGVLIGLADRYPFEPGSLTSAANAVELFGRYPAYASTLRWLDEVFAGSA